jgi:hypothetical protein
MAKQQTRARAERLTHPLLARLGPIPAAAEVFLYSVKIVCGKQTETNCCFVPGARPGVYATEVNIQNLNPAGPAQVVKAVLPLINSGAVVAREPNVFDPATLPKHQVEAVLLPPLGVTMDDCCRIAELLLGGSPCCGGTGLTIAILTIISLTELSVSAVYTANPVSGDGISIDVEYIPSRRLGRGGPD